MGAARSFFVGMEPLSIMNKDRLISGLIDSFCRPFVFVDCGARGGFQNILFREARGAQYIGLEPDVVECERLKINAPKNHRFFPVAAGKRNETRTLYVTVNPSCSSLLEPDYGFWKRFLDCRESIEIQAKQPIETVALDKFLPESGIDYVDFVKLDTQGTELDILQGSKNFLSESILGVITEVEFSPMYKNQALFSDVDSFLRQFGFMLFDLSRHRYRRSGYPRDSETRGQLLAGDAFYLKDYRHISSSEKTQLMKLVTIASFYGFYDYALEIIIFLLNETRDQLTLTEKETLGRIRRQYSSEPLYHHRIITMFLRLVNHPPLQKALRHTVQFLKKITESYDGLQKKRHYEWRD